MSLRSSSQQPPVIYVKCDRLQPWIEPVTQDLSLARGTARPCRWPKRLSRDYHFAKPHLLPKQLYQSKCWLSLVDSSWLISLTFSQTFFPTFSLNLEIKVWMTSTKQNWVLLILIDLFKISMTILLFSVLQNYTGCKATAVFFIFF